MREYAIVREELEKAGYRSLWADTDPIWSASDRPWEFICEPWCLLRVLEVADGIDKFDSRLRFAALECARRLAWHDFNNPMRGNIMEAAWGHLAHERDGYDMREEYRVALKAVGDEVARQGEDKTLCLGTLLGCHTLLCHRDDIKFDGWGYIDSLQMALAPLNLDRTALNSGWEMCEVIREQFPTMPKLRSANA